MERAPWRSEQDSAAKKNLANDPPQRLTDIFRGFSGLNCRLWRSRAGRAGGAEIH
jgi:hypothetical protein